MNWLHLPIYSFTSASFPIFLGLAAIVYRFVPPGRRALFLTLASYFFYFNWSHRLTSLLLLATAATYFAARAIDSSNKKPSRAFLTAALVSALAFVLVLYKASPFYIQFLRGAVGHPWLQLIMPLGISYYTFKLVGYVLDVYWEKIPAEKRFFAFAAYAAFFPQIVAGPIQRAESFLVQIETSPKVGLGMAAFGVQRILLGLFKKFIVADNIGLVVNFVYQHLHVPGTPALFAFYGYPLQLYADFSGLSDIAIGAALLLGIQSPENFEAPFAAANIADFWRRWHITLTMWLTDYVYTPARMALRNWGNAGLVLSLFVNMVLIGLWHGFRWTFFAFGLVHAIYLSVYALSARSRKRLYKRRPYIDKLTTWMGPIFVFHLVAIAMVFFRAETVGDAFYCLSHLENGIPNMSPEFQAFCSFWGRTLYAGAWGYALAEVGDYLRRRNQREELVMAMPRWGRWSAYSCTATVTIIVVLILIAIGGSASPFMYQIF